MASVTVTKREYPDQPLVGVAGVVIDDGRTLLIRRAKPPYEGQWSIPGGLLELGETVAAGVARELSEETGLEVNVLDLIGVFERILPDASGPDGARAEVARPQYHFVILDYLCTVRAGTLRAGSDALEFAWALEDQIGEFDLSPMAGRALRKAFAMVRAGKPSDAAPAS